MMINQVDKDFYKQLEAQLAQKTGAGTADFSLRYDKTGKSLTLHHKDILIETFEAPVRAGQILSAYNRYLAKPQMENLPHDITIGPYAFQPRRSALMKDGEAITLTDKERDILVALWSAPKRALNREALLDAVWAYADGVETHTLETHVYRLRRKMESDPGNPQWLVNTGGLYQLKT